MAVAASATVLVSGCAQVGAQELDASQLTISAITYPTTYDPSGSEWGNRSGYYQAVFDTLLLASTEGTIEPWLATEWSYNEDNTELTLTLRDDVTFSDGSQMTGDVVAQNLLRFRDGTSPDAGYFAGIESVDAPNDTTVVINLAGPEPAMLNYLTRDPGLVASAESFDNPDIATTPVGSGPYIFDKGASVIGSSYIYTKNPNYWNPEVQHYEGLRINVISDPTAILNTVQAGEANAVRLVTNDNLIPVEDAGWTLNSNELDFQGILLLDRAGTANPALGDVKVRQAINHAMDRAGLLEALQQDAGTVTGQVFPITSDAYDPALDERYPYDPAKAALGIEADLILFHAYDRWGFADLGPAADDRYVRYAVRRLAGLPNVWWSMANEFDLLGGKVTEDWERLAELIVAEDPHDHLQSIHNCMVFYDQSRPWVTHVSAQRVDVYRTAENVTEWRAEWGKPVVVDECAYEGDIDQGWGNVSGQS